MLGVSSVYRSTRRRPHYDDEVVFVVQSIRLLVEVVVPFMDAHLPASQKRRRYLIWREQLMRYWDEHARRVRSCSEPGCERFRRAKGLCRSHYFQRHGR